MSQATNLKAVLFDMDGTLLAPINDGLPEFKKRWGIAATEFVIPNLARLPAQAEQEFLALEERVAKESQLRPGTKELLTDLHMQKIKIAIVTNNSSCSAKTVCQKHNIFFNQIISRDDAPMKPAPDMLQLALKRFGVLAEQALMIGDTSADLGAAQAAGITCWLLTEAWNAHLDAPRFASMQAIPRPSVVL